MKVPQIFNWPITLSSLLLLSVGILVIYSSSKELAIGQLLYVVIGCLFYVLILQLDTHSLKRFVKPLYFFIIFLLIAVLILGIETRGSIRWIPLGLINIQPSEFAKPVLILFLAAFWSKNVPGWRNVFKSLFWAAPVILLIFKQPDLGSSLTLVAIWTGMLFASKISLKKILILTLVALIIIPLSWVFLKDYQRQRITGFLSPESDPLGRGYNLIQSTIAVGSGQLWGRGLGRGTQSRLQFLPEFRTDFIFASIAEEMGFLGSVVILVLYLYLLIYILRVAGKTEDRFSYLLVLGVFSQISFQIFVNMGMNMGILPITGITLPLISYGGSSLVATIICLGLVSSVSKSVKRINPD